jgi:hypothetical protein
MNFVYWQNVIGSCMTVEIFFNDFLFSITDYVTHTTSVSSSIDGTSSQDTHPEGIRNFDCTRDGPPRIGSIHVFECQPFQLHDNLELIV